MHKTIIYAQLLSLALFAFGCGGADIENNEDAKDLANSQCTVQESPDGEQSVIRCSDGSMAVIKNGQPGFKGEDGTDGQNGEDGKSVDVRERVLPVGDPNCPSGGTAIEFYAEDEATPSAVNYQCNAQSSGECEAGSQLDPTLNLCIPWVEVRFSGVVSATAELSAFPPDLRPPNVITSEEDPAQATPCSGVIRSPQGLAPTSGYSSFGVYESEFVFGHVDAYGIEVTLDSVTFERDVRFDTPSSATHQRRFSNTNTGSELSVSSKVSPLKGFDANGESSIAINGLRTLASGDDFSFALPRNAASWSLLSMPTAHIEYTDASFSSTGSITCQITQFADL